MRKLSDVPEKPIALSRISEDPGPYCMSFRFELGPLIRSIEKIGLIHPPLVVKGDGDCLDVVIGYRRILALKSLKCEEAPMKDLSDLGLQPLDLLLFNLYDNLSIRPFNVVEKGMILNRLKPHLSEEEILKGFMPLLGLPPHEEARKIYGKLEALDPELKASSAEGDLALKTIKALLETDPNSRGALFEWIKDLRFNFNQQLLFVENTEDISVMEEISVPQVLRDKSLMGVRGDEKLNTPQKAKRVLALLKSKRFPLLTRSEEAFEKEISSLGLPERVKISHPPFFEDSHYRLEILFENGRKLEETIKQLDRLSGLEGIGDPWEEKP
jgi:hypothetical protein